MKTLCSFVWQAIDIRLSFEQMGSKFFFIGALVRKSTLILKRNQHQVSLIVIQMIATHAKIYKRI